MPYCTQCGSQVATEDRYCATCGRGQPAAQPAGTGKHFLSSMDPWTAALLCYIPVVGWIPAVVVLAAQRFRQERTARFHAFQGLYLFVAWLIVDWGFPPFFFGEPRLMRFGVGGILKAVIFGIWIFMIIKTSRKEDYRLPLIGDLAERSLSEQR